MPLADRADRLRVLSRIRWLMALAALVYAAVMLGLGLTPLMDLELPAGAFLTLLPLFFLAYNSLVVWLMRRERLFEATACALTGDLLAVTIALYGTGGLSSWLWSLYPFVTLEAAFVSERKRWTIATAASGAVLYGAMLEAEHLHWLLSVHTPVTDLEAALPASYRFLKWSWVALTNAAAAVAGLMALHLLAGMRRSLEAALSTLDAQYAQLRELDALKSTFLSVVSHELRTPLAVLRGYTELLEDDRGLTSEGRAYLAEAEASAAALSDKVDMVIAYSTLASGTPLRREPASARELLEAALEACRDACLGAHQILLLEDGPDAVLEVDAAHVAAALEQLVDNARRATPPGGTIGLGCRLVAENTAELQVWDTGPGVPACVRERLGEPFVAASPKLSEHTPGLGLGLAYAQLVASLHGGCLALDDRPGGGTIARLRLPLATGEPLKDRQDLRMRATPGAD